MAEKTVLIEFKGILTFVIIGNLINELKGCLSEMDKNVNTYKRILVIMVETLENICKYGEQQKLNSSLVMQFPTTFKLIKEQSCYQITAGNLINSKDQFFLEDRINTVNNLQKEELKNLYREIIANGQFNNEGGAGLGFIEIAKTSGQKISFTFDPINASLKYFTIYLELRN